MSGKRLISVVALCFCLLGVAPTRAADVHVSANKGVDSGTCGSFAEPCRTIRQGVSNAGAGENVIKIAAGSYAEKITINSPIAGLTLQGGWDDAFSSRGWDPAQTILSSTDQLSPVLQGIAEGVTVNLALEGLNFRGPGRTGLRGTSTGSSAELGISMKNCIIEFFTQNGIDFLTMPGGTTSVELVETIVRNNIQENDYGSAGAGMRVSVTEGSAAVTLRNSRFLENQSLNAAGGLCFHLNGGTTTARLENSIVAGNHSSSEGGGMIVLSGNQGSMDLNLTNSTIFNNISESFGGGLRIRADDSNMVKARLRNTIIWGNGSPFSGRDISQTMQSFPNDDSGINADYSIIGDVDAGNGNYTDGGHNLNVDPGLDITYHLNPGSPAVDAGICGFKPLIFGNYIRIAPYDDIDGDRRPGFGELTGCDIGADELRSGLCFPVRNRSGGISIICM